MFKFFKRLFRKVVEPTYISLYEAAGIVMDELRSYGFHAIEYDHKEIFNLGTPPTNIEWIGDFRLTFAYQLILCAIENKYKTRKCEFYLYGRQIFFTGYSEVLKPIPPFSVSQSVIQEKFDWSVISFYEGHSGDFGPDEKKGRYCHLSLKRSELKEWIKEVQTMKEPTWGYPPNDLV